MSDIREAARVLRGALAQLEEHDATRIGPMLTGDELRALIASTEGRDAVLEVHPFAEWHHGDGPVMWWKFPIEEPPYVGTPDDLGHTVELHTQDTADGPRVAASTTIGGWPGYHTHWTRLPDIRSLKST